MLPFYLVTVADGAFALRERWLPRADGAAAALAAAWLAAAAFLVSAEMRRQAAFGSSFEAMVGSVRAEARPGDTLSFASIRLARNVLYHLDRPAFGRVEWRAFAQPLPIDPAGRTLRLVVAAPTERQARDTWLFEGTVDDFTVAPPRR